MLSDQFFLNVKKPLFLFALGWCALLLAPWIPVFQNVVTFVNPWRVEIIASILFSLTLLYAFFLNRNNFVQFSLSPREIYFIVAPISLFSLWSACSMSWSTSSKTALYHTLVWIGYLIFYLIVRKILTLPGGYRLMLGGLTACFLLIGIPAIFEYCSFQYFGGATKMGMRFSKYGEQIITFFPLVIIGVLGLRGRRFYLGLLAAAVLWMFIFTTLSRTNLLLFSAEAAAIIGIVLIFKRFRKYKIKAAQFAMTLVLFPILIHSVSLFTTEQSIPLVKRMNDATGISYSGDFRKLALTISIEMFKTHPFTGIGAGNYGIQFNNYRLNYAVKNANDPNLTTAENEIAERSHNEYAQILAELGIIGLTLFAGLFIAVGLMIVQAFVNFRRISLLQVAALIGVCGFLASSLVSSFSFRMMQNGLVFFFVLAVAAKSLLVSKKATVPSNRLVLSGKNAKLVYACGIAASLLLFANCLVRVSSVYYTLQSNEYENFELAEASLKTAAQYDNENPDAEFVHGFRLILEKRFAEAAEHFKREINLGRGAASDYAYLAMVQKLSGDTAGAEETMAEAVKLYPFSPFIRTSYASLLQTNGKTAEAADQLSIAGQINSRETNTWWIIHNEGVRAAELKAFGNDDYLEVLDLPNGDCLRILIAERELKYGKERPEIAFGK